MIDELAAIESTQNFNSETQAPSTPPTTGYQGFISGSVEEGIRPTKAEKFITQAKINLGNAFVGFPGAPGTVWRSIDEMQTESINDSLKLPKITPEEALKQYGVKIDAPMYPEVVKARADEKTRQSQLNAWAERGPETGWMFDLAAGGATMLDPANLALQLAGAKAVGAIGSRLLTTVGAESKAFSSLFKVVSTQSGEKIVARTGMSFAENAAANVAGDSLAFQRIKQENPDAEYSDTLKNAFAGAAFGTALHKLLAIGYERAAKTTDSVKNAVISKMIQQHEMGKTVDVTPVEKVAAAQAAGEVANGESTYTHKPIEHPSETTHYVAQNADNTGTSDLGKSFGSEEVGINLEDNPHRVNNLVANPEGNNTGKFTEAQIAKEAKFLNLEKTMTDPEAIKFVEALNERLGTTLEPSPETTLHKVMDDLRGDIAASGQPATALWQDIAQVAKGSGYDGYKYVYSQDGKSISNGAFLFNKEQMTLGETFQANKEIAPKAQVPEVKLAKDAHYDPDLVNDLKQYEGKPSVITPEESSALAKQQELQARRIIQKESVENAELADEVTKVDQEFKAETDENNLVKQLGECIITSIT